MSGDRSRSQASGSGGPEPQEPGAARADDVIDRGLGLYSQGRLAPALAEWRRALELDPANQRAAEYVAYVEDHFALLDEKFRDARLKRAEQGEAIEIEADDPADDLDAYESIELDLGGGGGTGGEPAGSPGGAATTREPAAGGHSLGPAGEVALDALDEGWSLEGIEDLWPGGRDEIDTAEIPQRSIPELPQALGVRNTEELRPELAMTLPGRMPGGGDSEAATDYEDPQAPTVERPGVRLTGDEGADSDPATGEITLPAPRRVPHDPSSSAGDASEGDALYQAAADGQAVGFDLSDGAVSLSLDSPPDGPVDSADPEIGPDRTLPGGTSAPPGAHRPPLLPESHDPDPLEVRVTFRLPISGGVGDPADDGDDDELTIDRRTTGSAHGRDTEEQSADSIGMALADAAVRASAAGTGEHQRAPTEDPAIEASSVIVDETLLSFEDETHELPSMRLLVEDPARDRGTAPVVVGFPAPGDRDGDGLAEPLDDEDLLEASDGDDDGDDDAEPESERQTTNLYRRPLAAPQTAASIELMVRDLQADLEGALGQSALAGDDLTRARIGWLIERARRAHDDQHHAVAVLAIDLALEEDPASAVAQKLIHSHHELFHRIYNSYLGDLREVPGLALPMDSIPVDELDHRAAFLLSRVDGALTIDDVLDVSGMPRLEAFRHLCRLLLRGILVLRP